MRALLLADAHANWEALLALQRAEQRPEAILFAGDAVGYGPDPAEVVRWLVSQANVAVRGPLDRALDAVAPGDLSCVPPELADAARETLAYARRRLPAADLERVARWPDGVSTEVGGVRFFVQHGTPSRLNPATASEAELDALFGDTQAQVIVLGGAHLPAIRQFGQRVIVNPGSLGQPRYGVPDPTYGVWDDGHLQIKHLHYHPERVIQRLRLAPLSPEVIDTLGGLLQTGML